MLLSDLEQEATTAIKKMIDKTYLSGGSDNKLGQTMYTVAGT